MIGAVDFFAFAAACHDVSGSKFLTLIGTGTYVMGVSGWFPSCSTLMRDSSRLDDDASGTAAWPWGAGAGASGLRSSNSGRRYNSFLSNLAYKRRRDEYTTEMVGDGTRTGGTLILTTSCAYDLSYKQFPSKFPKFRRVRLSASVIASFLH